MFNFLANQSICMVYTVQEVQKHYSKIGFHGRQKIYKTGKVKSAVNPKMKTLIFTHPHLFIYTICDIYFTPCHLKLPFTGCVVWF